MNDAPVSEGRSWADFYRARRQGMNDHPVLDIAIGLHHHGVNRAPGAWFVCSYYRIWSDVYVGSNPDVADDLGRKIHESCGIYLRPISSRVRAKTVGRHYSVSLENQALAGVVHAGAAGRFRVGPGRELGLAIIAPWGHSPPTMWQAFIFLLTLLVRLLRATFKSRGELVLENLALRQQVGALKLGKHKPKLHDADRAFWIALRKTWANWTSRLLIVKPETVVDWQRRRFRRHWTRISQQGRRPGRPAVGAEIRDLIRQMVRENHWGAPRILSELQKLGFAVSETTVSRYVRRFRDHSPDPDLLKRWISFLRNHKDAIAGMDFFTVPTATLSVLYGFFVIHHDRRRILHFNATYHPTAQWVMQQLREAFPFDSAPRHLIFDRDSIFCPAVVEFVNALGTRPRRIAYRCPWQNPVAERWIGSLRRELLDHVVVLGQQHLLRLVNSYVRYHHEDRCHLGLDRDTPDRRPVTPRPSPHAKVVALPRVGGLHQRYVWREAA